MNMKKDKKDIEMALTGLLEKYNLKPPQSFRLYRDSNPDILNLLPGYDFVDPILEKNQVPLLTWRVKRKFVELEKIVKDSVIENVCLFRFCCIGSKDKWLLSSLLYREMDLLEFIGNGKIISVQAVIGDDQVSNVILRLDNGALCSIEAGIQMPPDTPLIERHEIIAQRGVASDLVVDTNVPQSSIYCYSNEGERRYTDVDMELYGFDDLQIDHIRSAFQVIKNPELMKQWQQQHKHLVKLVGMVIESNRKREKVNLN
jgi:hypothetical protein